MPPQASCSDTSEPGSEPGALLPFRPSPSMGSILLDVADIHAPVPIVDLEATALPEPGAPPIEAPYFVVLWADQRVVGLWSSFRRSDRPLDWQQVYAARDVARPPVPAARADGGVSVVICTRDREEMLASCLQTFARQTRRPDQLIVVDNASRSPGTREAAERHGVTYIREDRPGLSYARNAGVSQALHEIVAFTDDDTLLHPQWLERLSATFDSPDIWAATGLVLPSDLGTLPQCIFERDWGFGRGLEPRDFGRAYYLDTRREATPVWELGAGANMALRRSAIERVGGFEPRLGSGPAGCGDDSEFWYRILHAGGTCRYEPSAIVWHTHRSDEPGLRRQIRSYMCGHVAALMVQYERTGDRGNLRRILVSLPHGYMRKSARRLLRGPTSSTCLLSEEVLGSLSGIRHYLRTRREPLPAIGPAQPVSS
jgi:GT2 family glycosyltransferase